MKRWILILIPVVVLGVLIANRFRAVKKDAAAQAQQRAARSSMLPVVSVTPAEGREFVQSYEAVGTVESQFTVPITPKVTGRILYVEAREGDRVTPGQVLVRIDPSEVEADVRREEAALAEARSRLAQAQLTQNPTNVGVASQIRQQQAAVRSAEAEQTQVRETNAAQLESAAAAVRDAQSRIESAEAAIANGEAAIRSAQANLENGRVRHSRVQELYKQGFIAAQDVDDARTTVSVQQSAVETARGQLNAARAQKSSAEAQKDSAQRQVEVVRSQGKASLEAARARVTQARASLDVARANTAQRPAYRASLEALTANVRAAQAAVQRAETRRADTVLRAPMNGFVTARQMDPGAMAAPGQPILTLLALKDVWMTASVPEDVSRKVRDNMPATVVLDGLPGREFTGRVVQVNPSADVQSRQFMIRVALPNPGNQIRPGMFGRVKLVTERVPGAVVVPREAITETPQGKFVTVVSDDGKAERRPVVVGLSSPKGYVIDSGLQPGEKVVTMSGMPVKDGAMVRVAGAKPPQGQGGPGSGQAPQGAAGAPGAPGAPGASGPSGR
jgi:RND family efflux transporter MFP subunit